MKVRRHRISQFKKIVWAYYRREGRHNLPWRQAHDPYRILVSEVMLQQTQVARVLIKYPKFIRTFPNVRALARAPLFEVLKAWQGMGYNRRAVSLKRTAQIVVEDYQGKIPNDPSQLITLPGIGPATAGAITAYAYNQPAAFVETNIRRALIHHFFPRRQSVPERDVLELAEKTLDRTNPREWYWALMDYGSILARTTANPNRRSQYYHRQSPFKGSKRELRGQVVELLVATPHGTLTASQIRSELSNGASFSKTKLAILLEELASEGIIIQKRGVVALSR